jgi:ribosomal protein L29
LGPVGGVALAAVPELGVTAMTFEDEYYMTWLAPDADKLDEADRVPLQLGPAAVQIARTASGGAKLAVALNRASHTATLVPIEYLAGKRRFEMAALAAYRGQMLAAFRDVLLRLVERLKDCICEHLLVNCPTCDKDDVVILACVEIRAKKVYAICNFHRREVVTFPKLFYWLSAVPIIPLVTEAIGELCCLILPDRLRPGTKPARDLTPAKSVTALTLQARALDVSSLQKNVTGYLQMLGSAGAKAATGRIATLKATPAKLRADNVLNRSSATVRRSLADAGVAVNAVRPVSAAGDLPRLTSLPLALAPGDRVDLFTENGKVVFYTRVAAAQPRPQTVRVAETGVLRSDLDALQRGLAERDLAAEQQLAEHAREIAALKAELARLRGAAARGGAGAKVRARAAKRPARKA